MTLTRWVALAILALMSGGLGGRAHADDPPAAPAPAQSTRDQALANGLGALKLRMEGKLKEVEILRQMAKWDEALAAAREVDALYREGMADLNSRPRARRGRGSLRGYDERQRRNGGLQLELVTPCLDAASRELRRRHPIYLRPCATLMVHRRSASSFTHPPPLAAAARCRSRPARCARAIDS